jgi:hypothetical protein
MDDAMAPAACQTVDLKGRGKKTDIVCLSMREPYWLTWYEYAGK